MVPVSPVSGMDSLYLPIFGGWVLPFDVKLLIDRQVGIAYTSAAVL